MIHIFKLYITTLDMPFKNIAVSRRTDATKGSCLRTRVRQFAVSKTVGLITSALPPLRPWPLWCPWQMRGPLSRWVIFLTLTPNYWVGPTLLFITVMWLNETGAISHLGMGKPSPHPNRRSPCRFNVSLEIEFTGCTALFLYNVKHGPVFRTFSKLFWTFPTGFRKNETTEGCD